MNYKDKELFIFDMDGLIFDSETLYILAIKDIITKKGFEYNEALIYKTIGTNEKTFKEILYKEYGDKFPIDNIAEEIDEEMLVIVEKYGLNFMQGAKELLEILRNENKIIALASSSNKNKIISYLKRSNILDVFNYIISGNEVKNGKPDPEIFQKACDFFDIKNENAIVFEDSFNGIRASFSANIDAIMIPDKLEPNDEMKEKSLAIYSSLNDFITEYKR